MEIYFGSNIKTLRERKKRTQQDLADFIGIKRSLLANYENNTSNPSIKSLLLISDYFNITIDTLLCVDFSKLPGTKLAELERGTDNFVKGAGLRVLATTVTEKNEENVEMVSIKVKAGYTRGFADPDFIGKLPAYYFPLLPKNRKHRLFQIEGNSMLPIKEKSWIACEYVEDWNDIKDGSAYVIVTKDDGLVFKVVYNRIKVNRMLLLVSLNLDYTPYEIPIENVCEVWKFSMRFSIDLIEG